MEFPVLGQWEDGDHLMRASGDVYTIHFDESTKQGWIERFDHWTHETVKIIVGGPVVLGDQWRRFQEFCFIPTHEFLDMVDFPRGMR